MKIVGPTIVEPWCEQIENATTIKRLSRATRTDAPFYRARPACGIGNFLYMPTASSNGWKRNS